MEQVIITALIVIGALVALGLIIWLTAFIFAAKQIKKIHHGFEQDVQNHRAGPRPMMPKHFGRGY